MANKKVSDSDDIVKVYLNFHYTNILFRDKKTAKFTISQYLLTITLLISLDQHIKVSLRLHSVWPIENVNGVLNGVIT